MHQNEKIKQRYQAIAPILESAGQQHVLAFWSELNDQQQLNLLDELDSIDFERLAPLIDDCVKNPAPFELPEKLDPAPLYPAEPRDDEQQQLYRRAWDIGEEAIREGKVCAFTVAGGMGTRLGYDGPKGCFKIGPLSDKSLFQLFAEYILNCKRRYNNGLRWFLMTSTANHDATIEFFETNDYFGLNPQHVTFFQQGMMPAFSADGKLLLADKGHLAMSPDGHGGSLRALKKSGALETMEALGIEYISYFQVDNPLVRCLDPHFIGLHILTGSDMSSRSIPKAHDTERVGNFVIADGKLMVIEYSDLPETLATARNADGTRMFDAGSIAIHLISREFVERITAVDLDLPFHRANKKVSFVDASGTVVTPEKPNAVKLEQFVFDAIPLANNPIVVETVRAEEFSPVKNAEGNDSPETCRRDLIARAKRWMQAAGMDVGNGPVEISPEQAIFPDDLKAGQA